VITADRSSSTRGRWVPRAGKVGRHRTIRTCPALLPGATPLSVDRFEFAFDPRFRVPLRLLGVHPGSCHVIVDDERFQARYGPWKLVTPIDNVADVAISRGYRWFRAIGPRGSMKDRGATFGTNAWAGTCVSFREPVGALLGEGRFEHPGLTVTVADPDALADAIRRRLRPSGEA
jgi:hypothetical protein